MKKKRSSIGILVFLLAVAFLLAPSTDAQPLVSTNRVPLTGNLKFVA